MAFSYSALGILFPNALPPDVVNSLLFVFLALIIIWVIHLSKRCFSIFEGFYSYKKGSTILIKVKGVDEICKFWRKDSVRKYLLSFLRETLESPTTKMRNIKGTLEYKDSSFKEVKKSVFGRDHSKGIGFTFSSIVRSSVTCYWKLNEELFNEKILKELKKIQSREPNDDDNQIIDFNEIANSKEHNKSFLKKTEIQEFEAGKDLEYEMEEEEFFLLKDEGSTEEIQKRGYVNDVQTFFLDFKKKKKEKEKEESSFVITQEELDLEKGIVTKSFIPLLIYVKNLEVGKSISEEEKAKFKDEVVGMFIICHFVDNKRPKVDRILFQTKRGVYTLSEIFGQDSDDCVICLSERKQITFLPCGHWCICKNCLKSAPIESCVICRKNIDGYLYKK